MKRPFVEHLKTHIADGDTTLTLKILLDFLANYQPSLSNKTTDLGAENPDTLRDECILHQSALKKSDKDLQCGLITEDEHNQVASRVNYALLSMFSEIESLNFDDSAALQRAKLVENEQSYQENAIGNVKQIKKHRLIMKAAIGIGGVALLTLIIWFFKHKFFAKEAAPNVTPQHQITHTDSLLAAQAHYNIAVEKRSNNGFDACITECEEAIKWNSKSGLVYNQLAECYLYKGDITPAFENAKKAYQCDSFDTNGYIMSTLAQIYGEMGNTKLFYIYTEQALKRDLPVWKYENELGFKMYKDEPQFKVLMKKYK